MALINCEECGGMVSTQAAVCPHCGFPVRKNQNIKQEIIYKERIFDVSNIILALRQGKEAKAYVEACGICVQFEPANLDDIDIILNCVRENFDIGYISPVQSATNVPRCPTCGSTNLIKKGIGARMIDGAVFGRMSVEGRSQFRCNNCSYEW